MPITHLGHAELLVTDLAASRAFFVDIRGLQVSEEREGSVFLRAWQDWDHHTLQLTEAPESGLAHLGWRVPSKADADEIRTALDAKGITVDERAAADNDGHGD